MIDGIEVDVLPQYPPSSCHLLSSHSTVLQLVGRRHHKVARNIVKEVSKLNLEHTFQMRYPPKDLRDHLEVTLHNKLGPIKAKDIIDKIQGCWEDITLFHGIVSDMNNPKVLEQLLRLFPFSESVMRMLSVFSNGESDKLMQEMLNFVCYGEEIFLDCIGPQDTVSESMGFEKYLGIQRRSKGLHDLRWNSMFKKLKDYKQENGHCNVPRSEGKLGELKKLGQWVSEQRQNYKAGNLSKERIDALKDIGFEWDAHEAAWRRWFKELEAYKKENGHCNVPQLSKERIDEGKLGELKKLAQWVTDQRQNYKEGNLSKERIDALKDIGFEWDPNEAAWRLRFEELKAYKQKNGHCNLPQSEPELGKWVNKQRYAYKAGNLSKERIDALNEINFVWDAHEAAWRLRFEELEAYKQENGHCNVPCRSKGKLKKLGKWVEKQRSRVGNLSKERIDALKDIGFIF